MTIEEIIEYCQNMIRDLYKNIYEKPGCDTKITLGKVVIYRDIIMILKDHLKAFPNKNEEVVRKPFIYPVIGSEEVKENEDD